MFDMNMSVFKWLLFFPLLMETRDRRNRRERDSKKKVIVVEEVSNTKSTSTDVDTRFFSSWRDLEWMLFVDLQLANEKCF